jgi:hypothetical protein
MNFKAVSTVASVVCFLLPAMVQFCEAQPWVQTTATNAYWLGIASSDDGSRLTAIVWNGPIYRSCDSGETWHTNGAPALSWMGIASSSDGSKLAACSWSNGIYLSTNFGESWQQSPGTSDGLWQVITCSSGGSVVVAGSLSNYGILTTGPLVISTNGGANWMTADLPTGQWAGLACSSNGSVIVAASQGQAIYTTTNCGLTWATNFTTAPQDWSGVACSGDGRKQFAVSIGSDLPLALGKGGLFYSMNFGADWIQSSLPGALWESITCSKDGNVVIASADAFPSGGTFLWISTDSGTSWTSNQVQEAQINLASSAHGTKLAASFSYLGIFTWQWQPMLNVALSNQSAVISWPTSDIPAVLQQSSSLDSSNWNNLLTTNGSNYFVFPFTGPRNFYRLKISP